MKARMQCIADGIICLALFLITGFTRAISADVFVTWDEPAWVYRSVKFLLALQRGDLAGTMLVGHPGVLTMWSGALSLAWHRFITGSVSQAQLAAIDALPSLDVHDPTTIRQLVALLPLAKAGMAILHAAIVVVLFLLLKRLLDRRYALVAALFLISNPYYLALSRVLHIDALTSGLMLISIASMLLYVRRPERRYLVFSGVAAGLAALTKSYGVLVAPLAGLYLLAAFGYGAVRRQGAGAAHFSRLLLDVALWGVSAVAVFVALWPAMWVAPLATLQSMLGLSLEYTTSPGDATAGFFRGRFVKDPGLAFYPVSMWFRTTPLVLVGILLALLGLRLPERKQEEGVAARRPVTLALVAYVLLYIAIITISRKKYDRYILPALLGLDLLAALGWAGALDLALSGLGLRGVVGAPRRWAISGLLASLLVIVQAVMLLGPFYPAHYLACYNPWAGGLAGAVQAVPVGWGEGIEQIAAYLAGKPNAGQLTVATWSVAGLAPFFPGRVTTPGAKTSPAADYVLLYVADIQGQGTLAGKLYGAQPPEFVLTLNGVEYAWLYSNTYYEQLDSAIAREATPGAAVIANMPSAFDRHSRSGLPCQGINGPTEEDVAAQMRLATANARRVFYLEYEDSDKVPGVFIRRQLAQNGALLRQEPFIYGTLYEYLLPAGNRFARVPAMVAMAADVGPLRLEAFGLSGAGLRYPQELGFALQWRALQRPKRDYHISLCLVDEQGRKWGQCDGPLEDNSFACTSAWQAQASYLCNETIPLAPGIPPGRYWLTVGVYNLEDLSHPSVFSVAEQTWSAELRIGPIEVDSALVPPAVEELGIPNLANQKLGSAIELLGYALPAEAPRSGEDIEVTLFWRCLERMDTAYELDLRLERAGATVSAQRFQPAGPAHSTSTWAPGELLRKPQLLTVPADAPTGDYDLFLNLYDGNGRPLAERAIRLGRLHVEHRARLFSVPDIRFPFQATLGDQIELLGYDLEETEAAPGGQLHLTLYWKALRRTDAAYTVFTHLLDSRGAVRGQKDGVPLTGQHPTTGWVAGEIIIDPYEIPVDGAAGPGRYTIEIGLYDPPSGRRLPVTRAGKPTGEDQVLLPAAINVKENAP